MERGGGLLAQELGPAGCCEFGSRHACLPLSAAPLALAMPAAAAAEGSGRVMKLRLHRPGGGVGAGMCVGMGLARQRRRDLQGLSDRQSMVGKT